MSAHPLLSFAVLSFVALSFSFLATPAFANQPTVLSSHNAWTAYTFKEGNGTVCYVASQPTKAEGNYTKRGEIFALITHRPVENTRNVFSYIAGYDYKPGSEVTLTIDNQTFNLFTHKDMAWAKDTDTDNKIADAIRRGSSMVVKGTSARGTLTTDTYSLRGSGASHDAINRACNVR